MPPRCLVGVEPSRPIRPVRRFQDSPPLARLADSWARCSRPHQRTSSYPGGIRCLGSRRDGARDRRRCSRDCNATQEPAGRPRLGAFGSCFESRELCEFAPLAFVGLTLALLSREGSFSIFRRSKTVTFGK